MCRWTLLLCLACFGCIGCFACSLPLLADLGKAPGLTVPEEKPITSPVETTEQLLEQAAAVLSKGEELAAAALMEKYLEKEPRHLFIHSQVAELYFRQQKLELSRHHFQSCIALSQ